MRVISQSGSSGIQWDTSVGCLGNDGLGSTRYVARTVSACVLFLHFKTPFCTFLSIRRISKPLSEASARTTVQIAVLWIENPKICRTKPETCRQTWPSTNNPRPHTIVCTDVCQTSTCETGVLWVFVIYTPLGKEYTYLTLLIEQIKDWLKLFALQYIENTNIC